MSKFFLVRSHILLFDLLRYIPLPGCEYVIGYLNKVIVQYELQNGVTILAQGFEGPLVTARFVPLRISLVLV